MLLSVSHEIPWLLVGIIFLPITALLWYLTIPRREVNDIEGPMTNRGLVSLAVYKYKACEYTYLDEFLNPWWTFAANQLPPWIAPNVVTLLGMIFYVPSVAYMVYESQYASATRSSVVFAMCAFATLWYQTFDAMDGKHARKTGVAGPLGQLFDHGIDAMCTSISCVAVCCALRYDVPVMLLAMTSLQFPFFLGQWAEKYTHVLITNISKFMGVSETHFIAISVFIGAAIDPEHFWTQPLGGNPVINAAMTLPNATKVVSVINTVVSSIVSTVVDAIIALFRIQGSEEVSQYWHTFNILEFQYNHVVFSVVFIGAIYMFLYSSSSVIYHIILDDEPVPGIRDTPSSKWCRITKKIVMAFAELIPIVYLLTLIFVWYRSSLPNSIHADQGSFFISPLLSMMMVSVLIVHLTCQMIISTMTGDPYAIFQPSFIPVTIIVLIDYVQSHYSYPIVHPYIVYFLWVSTLFFNYSAQLHWACTIVTQISNFFGIYVLRLGKKVKQPLVEDVRRALELGQPIVLPRNDGTI